MNHIRLGQSSIPTTETDRDRADIEGVTVQINPLPLLMGQPLDVNVTIDDPNLYVEQNPSGKWLEFQESQELEEGHEINLPIDIEANIELNNAQIALLPNGFKDQVKVRCREKQDMYINPMKSNT